MTNTNALSGQHVIVLGAGYAGLMRALQLAPHARVSLVEPGGHFTERIRSHERAAGRPGITHPLRGFLVPAGITHVPARVTAIAADAREIRTDDGGILHYDRLVYALGSRTAGLDVSTPGHVFTPESAAELHKRLLDGHTPVGRTPARPGSLAVVGGGLTGIELAAEIAEAQPGWTVRLITAGLVGAGLSGRRRDHVRRVLAARGVHLDEGHNIAAPDDVETDVVVWAASMAARTGLAEAAGLAMSGGRIAVGPALRSVSHPGIYAAGDAAAAASPAVGQLRMACATALPTGMHAARSVLADLRGAEPAPLRFRFRVQCVSLGRHDGLIQLARRLVSAS